MLVRTVFLVWVLLAVALLGLGGLFQASHSSRLGRGLSNGQGSDPVNSSQLQHDVAHEVVGR